MSLLKEILSSLDTTASAAPSAPSPVARLSSGSPKPAQRPAGSQNSAPEPPPLKRKASGPIDIAQPKIQRKDAPARPGQTNGASRAAPIPASAPGVVKHTPSSSTTTVPYRGTAGLGVTRPSNAPVKKPSPLPAAPPKAAVPAPKPAVTRPAAASPGPAGSAPAKKMGGYMAMLQKAKEKDQTKAAAPLVKHEPSKIMTKKELESARLQARAAAKGKKPVPGLPAKTPGIKADGSKEKRKAPELGYQGTARPIKKPADIGYKGTARPNSVGPPSGKYGPTAAKAKPKPSQSRYGGYADWSDVEEGDGEEEDDYASDASSDMEANPWEVDEEETRALKVAKKEDAEAAAEEERAKREKEERKRKLMAMNKAAASKRKY